MDKKTLEELQIFNQGMRDLGQGMGSIGQTYDALRTQKDQQAMGGELLNVMAKEGLQGLTPQKIAEIHKNYPRLGMNGVTQTIELIKRSGAAQKALEEYNTQVASTNEKNALTEKAKAETTGVNLTNTTIIPKAMAEIGKNNAAARYSNVSADHILALQPYQIKELEASIGQKRAAELLNKAQANRVVAMLPHEIQALDALTGQRNAAAQLNGSNAVSSAINNTLKATGVEPNAMDDNSNPLTYTGKQLDDMIQAANALGIGANVVVTERDKNGRAIRGYVSGLQPLGQGQRQTNNLGIDSGNTTERTYDPNTKTFR